MVEEVPQLLYQDPRIIYAPTPAVAWQQLVHNVYYNGSTVLDERGSITRELLNTQVTIDNPLKEDIPAGTFWYGDKLNVYKEQFVSEDKQGFVYTYGNRLRGHFPYSEADIDGEIEVYGDCYTDQIDRAIIRLNNCKESRRAISVTWNPIIDTIKEEVPCMILVDFKIREDKLHTTALWRSHDVYGAWFPNAIGLANLSRYVGDKVGIEVGDTTINSISAHIYETDFAQARKV